MNFVNPEGEGARILSLDGGDARCLSQLVMLQEIMHRLTNDLGRPVRPCEYFHSITGVGAGGVLAVLLGVLGMTVEHAMETFACLCEKVFPAGECSPPSRSERLKNAVQGVLDELNLPYHTRIEGDISLGSPCRVSLCYSAAALQGCRMLRNYKSRHFTHNPTIITAIQLSWATPGRFSSVHLGTPLNQEELVSAVNGFNNPALEAIREAKDALGKDRAISTLLSLGSGREGPVSVSSDGFLEEVIQQTENVEEEIERLLGTSNVYFRFSPQHTVHRDCLIVGKQLESVTSYTRAYVERERISRSVDDFLRASAQTSNINLELRRIARQLHVSIHRESHLDNIQASPSQSSQTDETLISELKVPGLQCASPLSGCMEGTREEILTSIINWTADFAAPNILWVKGYPGVGKSAIATKLVNDFGALRCLGSNFFFQRQNASYMTPQALWRTVAYDIARRYPTIHKIVAQKLKDGVVSAATGNVENLFRHLIYEPLIGSDDIPNARLPVVVIDALDECGGLDGQNSMHRKALMKTLSSWSRLPGRFKLIVTSRSEDDIERLFSKTRHHSMDILAGQTVDARSSEDILMFLTNQLQEIAAQYPRSLSPDWPGNNAIKKLAGMAAGLFIWAETVVKFIALGDAPRLVDQILQDGGTGDVGGLYEQILDAAFRNLSEDDCRDLRSIVGVIILAKAPLSFSTLAQLLSMKGHTVERVCNGLQSVLDSKEFLQFYHQSFVDFLLDRNKCPPRYFIDPTCECRITLLACLQTMGNNLRFNICHLTSSCIRNAEMSDLPSLERKYIPPHLSYACWWWASHLAEVAFDLEILEYLQDFMRKQFLWWLKVLSITKRVNIASEMLSALVDWILLCGQKDTMAMAKDMQKFVTTFASPISQSVPHIYLSALPFSPQASAVSKQYIQEYPQIIRIQSGGLTNWPAIQHVLTGNPNWASSVAFSPDGKPTASDFSGRTIRVRDVEMGVASGSSQGHNDWIFSVAFSPDGKRIASGSADWTIRIWDAETGEVVAGPFRGHNHYVTSVAFSPDGNSIVSGSQDATVRVWNAETGEIVAGPFQGHNHEVMTVVFSPDGKCIASGSRDATVRVWDSETGEVVVGPFRGHDDNVTSVAFSPDGKCIVSGSEDATVRVWDAETGKVVAGALKGHSGGVFSVAFSPDGNRIVSGSADKTILVWDVETGKVPTWPFTGHKGHVRSVAFSPDGNYIVSGSTDGTIRVWDAEIGMVVAGPFSGHSHFVMSVAFSPDGKRIASGSWDHTIRVWDAEAGKVVVGPFTRHSRMVESVAFSPDAQRIISGSRETIRVWDAETGEMVAGPFKGHSDLVRSVVFSPDGKHIVSGSEDGTIRVRSLETREIIVGPFKVHTDWDEPFAFSPDRKRIVSCFEYSMIVVWDMETGKVITGPFTGHDDFVLSIAFSPDGKHIVSGSEETIRVWNTETGKMVAGPFRGHSDLVRSVAFSPDGTHIVSGSDDETILVWDAKSGEVIAGPFRGDSNSVTSVAFSPDGKRIVSGSLEKAIRVWDFTFDNSETFGRTSRMEDGWVLGPDSGLLFWVPPALRDGLWRPENLIVIGPFVTTKLDLISFVYGESWHLCKGQQETQ